MKTQFIILPFLLVSFASFAQYKQAEYTIGNGSDECYSMIQTNDGGYAMAGQGGSGGTDLNILKLDAIGNLQWDKTVGGGTTFSIGNSIVQSKDGGFVATGYCEGYGAGGEDVYVVKLDSNGNLLWTKTIGGPDDDWGNSIIQTTDGGYAITGGTKSYGGGTPNFADIYVIKLDSIGNKLWTKTLEGPWGSNDEGRSIIQAKDGGYAVTGDVEDVSGGSDLFVFKQDSLGNLKWAVAVGGDTDAGQGNSIIQANDAGFAVTGITLSYGVGTQNVYVVKLDSSGNLSWTKTIGGTKIDVGLSIIQTNDDGYAIAGGTDSYGSGGSNIYVIKLDSSGGLTWANTFGESGNIGEAIVQTKDGGYAVGGYYSSCIFLKIDSSGNSCSKTGSGGIVDSGGSVITGGIITSSDSGTIGSGGTVSSVGTLTVICESTSTQVINLQSEIIIISPNPSNGIFSVAYHSEQSGESMPIIEIYNVFGENILTETLRSFQDDNLISLTNQSNGIYLYRVINNDGGIVGVGKLIIQK